MHKFKKYKLRIFIGIIVLLTVFVFGDFVLAQTTDGGTAFAPEESNNIAQFLSWILIMITGIMGSILTVIIGVVDILFKFESKTANLSGINQGWIAVRDVCNMFFILIMLLIAFATILRYENYTIKKNLPKLVIAAVLINFSKTISYLLIDFSNIAMYQFASAFVGAPGNFVAMLSLDKLTAINNTSGIELDTWAVLYGVGLYFVVVLISLIIMVMLVAILTMRMIMFWVLIVLSPLAIFSFAMPSGGYFSKWWGEFSKYLIVGPVLAFFVWLALISVGGGNQMFSDITINNGEVYSVGKTKYEESVNKDEVTESINNIFISEFANSGNILNFILAIAFLVGGMKVTASFGVAGGNIGANMVGSIKNRGVNIAKNATRAAALAPVRMGRAAVGAGVNAAAGTGLVRGMLGAIGGSRAPLVNRLATNTLTGVENRRSAVREQAQQYAKNINDPRILARLANGRANLNTPYQAEVRAAARNKAPSTIQNNNGDVTPASVAGHVNSMSRENLQKLSSREWAAVGQSGAVLEGATEGFVRQNRDALGAYNLGAINPLDAMNRDGVTLTGNRGTNFNAQRNSILREGENENRYRKVSNDAKEQKVGDGRLNVSKFGSGNSNTIIAPLSEMGEEFKDEGDEYSDIKGISVDSKKKLEKVASAMTRLINKQIDEVSKSIEKAELSGDSAKLGKGKAKLGKLQSALGRFSDPSKLKGVNILNSEAKGFMGRDVMNTNVHEQVHEHGVDDEKVTRKLTDYIINSGQLNNIKGVTKNFLKGGQSIEHFTGGESHSKSVDELADLIHGTVQDAVGSSAGGGSGDSSNVNQINQKTKQIINNYTNVTPDMGSKDIMKNIVTIRKNILNQGNAITKLGKRVLVLTEGIPSVEGDRFQLEAIANEIKGMNS